MSSGRLAWKKKRDLILSILRSTTTKREAREYLKKYRMQPVPQYTNAWPKKADGIETTNPVIERFLSGSRTLDNGMNEASLKQLAIFRLPSTLSSSTFEKMIVTFRTLRQLGVSSILVIEDARRQPGDSIPSSKILDSATLSFADILTASGTTRDVHFTPLLCEFDQGQGTLQLSDANRVVFPILQESIPVIFSVAYDASLCSNQSISCQEALKALCESINFAGRIIQKIIFVDEVGGIPSIERDHSSHVFINNAQEYLDIISELHIGFIEAKIRDRHLRNLYCMNQLLSICHPGTTGIILKPDDLFQEADQLDPVSYNVLTDRPVISSSLPTGRKRTPRVSTSIVKNGFEVRVLFTHHLAENNKFDGLVQEGLIDEEKFVNMINDSFGKTLRRAEYLKRINKNLDCIILIGDYDGGAVITQELLKEGRRIAYLDKFAILKRNQGLPSLADVIFKQMLQSYQNEIIWRSRRMNPVNKWYFERCHGSFSDSISPWKLFFAGGSFNYPKNGVPASLNAFWELIQKIPGSFS